MTERAESSDAAFWGDATGAKALQRYRTLVNTIDDGIYQLDPDARFVAVNDVIVEMTGYDREELLGSHISVLVEDASLVEREIERLQASASERSESLELAVETASGERVVWELRVSRVLEDGELQGTIGIARDITERKRREREHDRVMQALEASREGIALLDENGVFSYVNDAYAETFGYDPEQMVGEHWDALGIEANPDQFYDEVLPHIAEEGQWTGTTTCVRRDDSQFQAEHSLTNTDDDELICIVRDVSDRLERERALQKSEQRYRTLVENFPNGAVGLVDDDLRYVTIGGTPLTEGGWTAEELEGREVEAVLSDDLAERIVPRYEAALDGESSTFEYTFEDRDRHARFHTFPVRDDDGEVFAAMGMSQDITEQVERERRLEESERLYRTLAQNFPDGAVGVYDEDLRYDLVEGAMWDSMEPDAADLIGNTIYEVFDEDIVADIEPIFRAAVESGETDSVTTEFVGRTLRVWATPLRDPDGEIFAGLSFAQDITEQVEREAELERARDLLERTERIADVGGWEIDVETKDVFWTEHIFDLLDIDADEEPPLEETLEMYHEEDRARVEESIQKGIDAGEPFETEARVRTENDEMRWLRLQGVPETTDGEVTSFRGAAQDVTEQVERERELRESKNQLQALIDVLPVAVFVAEADGRIVEWNEAARDIWGGEVVESGSVTEYDQYTGWWADTGERIEPDEWALARALDGEEVTDPDVIEIEGFDGKRRTVLNHGMPVRNADGEVTRAVVTLTDITERKEYQRKLEESNERLEQFAYAASHDLQEPLRMVSSYLQLIEDRYGDQLDEDGEEFLEFAVDGAERMRDMIDGLLDYSRIDTRGGAFEPVDLADVLADVRRDLDVKIEEYDAGITVEPLPEVYGDRGQLYQLLQNIVNNALEYSGDEPPRIRVSAEPDGDDWRVSVHDNGVGIDPADTDRVFDIFQSLHPDDEHDGTGIGLALAQRIVERHGGDIRVESEPGEGSTFSFTLPAPPE
ncbi:MAG: PAS domain S-box protein [Halolamina sp.]